MSRKLVLSGCRAQKSVSDVASEASEAVDLTDIRNNLRVIEDRLRRSRT